MQPDDDDSVDIRPWPVSELAGNLIASATVARRGFLESEAGPDDYERETDRFELEAWARTELVSWMTLAAFEILDAATGQLSDDQVERCHDALIEASTLAWVLNVVKAEGLPVFTDGESERIAVEWVPGPWTAVLPLVRNLRVRTDEQLAAERERWELLYWRLGLETPFDAGTTAAIRETVAEVAELNLLPVADGDFATSAGLPLSHLDDDAALAAAHEAEIRLRTLNWACGLGERLDSAPLMLDEDD